MIHHITPFRRDKNLGRAYNDAMQLIPDSDWVCIRDIDTLFLTPNTPAIIEEYTEKYDNAGILTCYTNRISTLTPQLFGGEIHEEDSIRYWSGIAEAKEKSKWQVTRVPNFKDISGFCMVIKKDTWNKVKFKEIPFPDKGPAIGVDTVFRRDIRDAGLDVLIMDAVLIWHTYRLVKGVKDKNHLL